MPPFIFYAGPVKIKCGGGEPYLDETVSKSPAPRDIRDQFACAAPNICAMPCNLYRVRVNWFLRKFGV